MRATWKSWWSRLTARKQAARERPHGERELLYGVLENPHDDDHLLIFADWLEDHDRSARADFIRTQVRRWRLDPDDPRRQDLLRHEVELRAWHEPAWWADLPRLSGVTWRDFERGFAVAQTQSLEAFHALAGRDIECWIALELAGNAIDLEALKQLAASPHMLRLTSLTIRGGWHGSALAGVLANSPHAANLQTLGLRFNAVGDEGIDWMAGSPYLTRVARLDLSYNQIGPLGLRALIGAPQWSGLRELTLDGNVVGPDIGGLARTAGKQTRSMLAGLSLLSLASTGVDLPGLQALATAPGLRQLGYLDLSWNHLGAEGALELARARGLERLRTLKMACNRIGDAGVFALAGWSELAKVRCLDLRLNRIGDLGATALARSPYLGSLAELDLSSNDIGTEVVRELLGEEALKGVMRLNLVHNRVDADALGRLRRGVYV